MFSLRCQSKSSTLYGANTVLIQVSHIWWLALQTAHHGCTLLVFVWKTVVGSLHEYMAARCTSIYGCGRILHFSLAPAARGNARGSPGSRLTQKCILHVYDRYRIRKGTIYSLGSYQSEVAIRLAQPDLKWTRRAVFCGGPLTTNMFIGPVFLLPQPPHHLKHMRQCSNHV